MIPWPAGTEVLPFENVEGIILVRGTLVGPARRDTTGPLVLDTGAGYLAIDLPLARSLGILDSASVHEPIDVAEFPLTRLTLGGWSLDRVEPVLTVDAEVVRRVTDRPVLGLIGQRLLNGRAIWIDYRAQQLAMVPAAIRPAAPGSPAGGEEAEVPPDSALARSRAVLGIALSAEAIPIRFRLVGDGKILVRGRVSDPIPPNYSRPLNLLLDTGATKCVLFEDALEPAVRHAGRWRALRGLVAPTLLGAAGARIARVPALAIESAHGRLSVRDVDMGVIQTELSGVLTRVTDETIHGLLGYSLLKRYRLAIDYPNHLLWLDPIPGYQDDRPFEYCHVGLQLERRGAAVVVTGVVEGSPAARAGIVGGDEVVEIDGLRTRGADLIELARRMEGEPGRPLTLVIRGSTGERTIRLVRRRLL